jgi:REP element-mobilizing transposase RayT
VTRERKPFFLTTTHAELSLDALEVSRQKHRATIHAYCVMPDHFHVLVGLPEGGSLQKFVRLFKQLSGYHLKQVIGDFAWQTSYYDHVLRNEETIHDVAIYIWQNPVEEGLAATWEEYPFSGPQALIGQV